MVVLLLHHLVGVCLLALGFLRELLTAPHAVDQLDQRIEGYHHGTYVVESVDPGGGVEHLVDSQSDDLMDGLGLVRDVLVENMPDDVVDLLRRQFVKHSVGAG